MTIVVRKDTPGAVAGANNEMTFLQVNSNGALRTEDATGAWLSSGAKSASAVIKDTAGTVGGLLVTAMDNGGDIDVLLWNSPDGVVAGDILICRVSISEAVAKAQSSWGAPSQCGVAAPNGIYLQIESGDCQAIVYYK